jgi:hypothetical protein
VSLARFGNSVGATLNSASSSIAWPVLLVALAYARHPPPYGPKPDGPRRSLPAVQVPAVFLHTTGIALTIRKKCAQVRTVRACSQDIQTPVQLHIICIPSEKAVKDAFAPRMHIMVKKKLTSPTLQPQSVIQTLSDFKEFPAAVRLCQLYPK